MPNIVDKSLVPGQNSSAPGHSKSKVNAGASKAEAPQKIDFDVVPDQSIDELGGPTPTDDSDAKQTIHAEKGVPKSGQGGNVVTRGSKAAEAIQKLDPAVARQLRAEEIDTEAREELDALLEDQEGLTDEFKLQAKTILEAALYQRLELELERLEEEFTERFEQEVLELKEQVESFLDYSSVQWLEENRIAVEDGVRSELNESFMAGLKDLFESHYVSVPDEKYDVFESMVTKLDEMEEKLNDQIQANIDLNEEVNTYRRQLALTEAQRGLTEAQKDKLASLAEAVEFDNVDVFTRKLDILKESFIKDRKSVSRPVQDLYESYEGQSEVNETISYYARGLG